jgi:hypothetical protein
MIKIYLSQQVEELEMKQELQMKKSPLQKELLE